MNENAYRVAAIVLAVLGLAAVVVGIMYIAIHAGNLPSFFPGHLKGGSRTGHRTKHGWAAIGAGIVLFILAGLTVKVGSRGFSTRS
jgi:hypothetical protein